MKSCNFGNDKSFIAFLLFFFTRYTSELGRPTFTRLIEMKWKFDNELIIFFTKISTYFNVKTDFKFYRIFMQTY